jgi:hypothetical protein
MTYILATSAAVLTGFLVDWGQRRCEAWAYMRDKDL